jgi:hypothetical protein
MLQAKSKIIMLKFLKEIRGKNSTRPMAEEAKKLNGEKDKDVSTTINIVRKYIRKHC